MQQLSMALNRGRAFAPLVLRVVLGGLFLWHGIDKFSNGIGNVSDMFATWGVPAASLTAPLTAIIEIVAGIMLIVGVGTRIAAILSALVMVGAIIFVKADMGVLGGAELDLTYLAGFIAIALLGPGPIAVDPQMGLEPVEASISTGAKKLVNA